MTTLRTTVRLPEDGARFLRFLVVGAFNTAFGYGLFCLALALLPTTFVALCASTILSILFNFFTTGSLVFGARESRRILRFYSVYAAVFAYNAVGLAFAERAGVDARIAGLGLLPGAVVGAYLLNRRYVFGVAA